MVDKIRAFGIVVSVAYLLVGVIMVNDTVALIDRGVETIALLDEYHYENPFYYPVVEFKDGAGSTVTAQSIDNTIRVYRYHDKVPIIYDPINPTENIRLNTFAALWLGPTFLTGAGAFVVFLSLGLLWNDYRKMHVRNSPIENVRGSGTESAHIVQSATQSTCRSNLLGG